MNNLFAKFPPQLIRASAGTGKTFALSNRFLGLLAAGENVDKILATTFTRKAAREIQERIFTRLIEGALDSRAAHDLGKQINYDNLESKKCLELLNRLVQQGHRLNVCTLDSFFLNMASNFYLELGFVGKFKIADGFSRRHFIAKLISEVCEDDILELMRVIKYGELGRSMYNALRWEILNNFELFRESDVQAWSWLSPNTGLKQEEVLELLNQLTELDLPKNKTGEVNKIWQRAISEAQEFVQNKQWHEFISKGVAAQIINGKQQFSRLEIGAQYLTLYQKLIEHAKSILLDNLNRKNKASYDLIAAFAKRYAENLVFAQGVSFDDVKHILSRAAIMGQLDELYYRLDFKLAHFLFDEFQDTSRGEWGVIYPLLDEVLSKADGQYSFFCVGDKKQAIYGWRGGVADIFDSLEKHWPQIQASSTETSYRCSQVVLDFVNQIFGTLPHNRAFAEYKSIASDWAQRFSQHTSANKLQGFVQIIKVNKNEEEAEEVNLLKEAALLVKKIKGAVPSASVAVLLRTNHAVSQMLYELSSPDIALRASEEGGNPLTDSKAVNLILSLLTACDHPADRVALYHIATSPLAVKFGISDIDDINQVKQLSSSIRKQISEFGFGSTILELAKALKAVCDMREFKRLMQLVELAHAFDRMNTARIADFVDFVKHEKVESPSAESLRVMTIHQAKGLEFDAVVLPELDFNLLKPKHEQLLVSRDKLLGPPSKISKYAPEMLRKLSPQLEEIYENANADSLKEALSLFYVALTRAKNALYLLVHDKAEEELPSVALSYASIVRERGSSLMQMGKPDWYATDPNNRLSEFPTNKTNANLQTDCEAKKVELKKSTRIRRKGLVRMAPSGFDGGSRVDLHIELESGDTFSRRKGLALHAILAEISWLEENMITDAAALKIISEHGSSKEEAQSILLEYKRLIANKDLQAILSRKRYQEYSNIVVEREFPFAISFEEGVLSGRFDRIVYSPGKFCEVIDFKSGMLPSDQRIQYYEPQMQAYKHAAAKLLNLQPTQVKTTLLFLLGF